MATAQELVQRAKALQISTSSPSGSLGGGLSSGRLSGGGGMDTKSSSGLYGLAVQNGLQADANRILARQSGEDVNKIFSGGFISDIFDALNALQYGVVGVLKGKTFGEGVRTRQSFSDKDALGDNGMPGVIGGIILDIVFDPLTYIAPASVVRKIPLLSKVFGGAKKAVMGEKAFVGIDDASQIFKTAEEAAKAGVRVQEKLVGGNKAADYLLEKFAYYTGKDPIYIDTFERSIRNMGTTTKRVVDLGKIFTKIDPQIAKQVLKLGKDGRFVRAPLTSLAKTLPEDGYKATAELYKILDDLGAEAVDLGLISKSKYEENIGEYIKAAYNEFETAKNKLPFGYNPQTIKGIKKRKDVLSEARKADKVDDPGYLLMKSSIDLVRDVENAKMFREVNKRFGRETAAEGFEQIPKTAKGTGYGELAGKFVPKYMADSLKQVIQPPVSALGKIEAKLVGNFKYAKVVLNPATHARNIISNRILNYWKLGMNPLDPRTMKAEAKAIKEIAASARQGVKLSDRVNETLVAKAQGYKSADEFIKSEIGKGFSETTELVKVDELTKYREFDRTVNPRLSPEAKAKLKADIKVNGIKEPLIISYGVNDGKAILAEGNHRLVIAKELGLTDVPVRVARLRDLPDGVAVSGYKGGGHIPSEMTPSSIGINSITKSELEDIWNKAQHTTKKSSTKYIDEATPLGYNLDTFASAELKGILEAPEMMTAMKKYGNTWDRAKKAISDIYQGEENQAKLAAYIYQREVKKLAPEEAWKAAVSATFDYAAVTPLIRKLRSSIFGMPFITFTYKATPLAIETAIKHPQRIGVIGKAKNAIENAAGIELTERERASEPPWVKEGFYVKIPGKDAEGRSRYFDLTYILPFGDLVSGNFFERGMNMETGTPESTAQAALRKSPFLQLAGDLAKNKDFYGNDIWKDSDDLQTQNKDILRHITKTFAPPLISDQIPGGYNKKGERQQRGIPGAIAETDQERMDQQRTLTQEMFRNLGIKVQPINVDIQEQYSEWNKKKALETLLKERGVLNSMEINYVPKDDQ